MCAAKASVALAQQLPAPSHLFEPGGTALHRTFAPLTDLAPLVQRNLVQALQLSPCSRCGTKQAPRARARYMRCCAGPVSCQRRRHWTPGDAAVFSVATSFIAILCGEYRAVNLEQGRGVVEEADERGNSLSVKD